MGHPERRAAIAKLQEVRNGTYVISYITSTRPGLEGQMAMDAIFPLYRHLQAIPTPPEETRIDLFLDSYGGDGIVSWRLVTLVREFCSEFNVLVPYRAYSAATLTALGADRVIMHPMGTLGPTDPSIKTPFNPPNPGNPQDLLPISVEDVASYIALVKDDVGIRHEDELVKAFLTLADKVHPLALGNVKRATSQSRMLGEKLLRQRHGDTMAQSSIEEVVHKLTSKLYFHGHPISYKEARDEVGLHFVEGATPEEAGAMWELYEVYHSDLHLGEQYDPKQDAIAKGALPVPAPGRPASQALVKLGPLPFVVIESTARLDTLESEAEVLLQRDATGNYQTGPPQMLSQKWNEVTDPA